MKLTLVAAIWLLGWPAAACVEPSDLARGIKVTYSDGRSEVHRSRDAGIVTIERRNATGITRWALAKGIYYVGLTRIEGGEQKPELGYSVTYPVPRAELPVPDGPRRIRFETRLTLPPDPPIAQRELFVFGPVGTLTVADCKYRAQRVENESQIGRDRATLDTLFLPDIGTSLFLNVDGNPDMLIAGFDAIP